MLQAGSPFPNFSLPNQDNKSVTLQDFAGQWLVLYVYPKDDTPGDTLQGKALRQPGRVRGGRHQDRRRER